jgi:hypothetical protein
MTIRPIELEVATRGLAIPVKAKPATWRGKTVDLGPSKWTLVFDTETTTGLGQRLRVGCYHLYKAGKLHQAGLFVDHDALGPDELAVIEAYAAEHRMRLYDRDGYVRQVFLRYAWRQRALIVGANLAFDLGQLAIAHCPAKDSTGFMRGGFTFTLTDNPFHPRVQVKRLGARATAFRFTIPAGRHAEARNNERGGNVAKHRGYFLDVLGLGAALFGQKLTLKALADKLGTEHHKLDTDEHGGHITAKYLDYLQRDVLVTWECAQELIARYDRFGFTETPVTRVYSEASIGKALLKQAGATPWRELQPDLPADLLAAILETYAGGNTTCRIRRVPLPGVYLDFLSQYPTVFVLQNLDRYLFATGFYWHDEDPAKLRRWISRLGAGDVLDPKLWPKLDVICLVQPDGDLLPTRARYRHTSRAYNLALAYRHGGPRQWWALADVLASKIETGRTPKILRVIRFAPRPRQNGLRPVDLNGDPRYRVDPNSEDLIKRLVELRQQLKTDAATADETGELDTAHQLEALATGVKVEANAIAYGTPIEINIDERPNLQDLLLHLPDGTTQPCRSRRVEQQGTWFNPLVATLVSSGGRLLLATAISLLHQAGGEYVFCDTDSLFACATTTGDLLACPGGPRRLPDGREAILALSHGDVQEKLIEPFRRLNPYNGELGEQSILELEPENLDPATHAQIEPMCLSIAAKRYAMFTLDKHGQPRLLGKPGKRRRSEHGLGHLLLPHDPDHPGLALDEFWEHLIACELDLDHPEPSYFKQPAFGRLTVTSQQDQNAYKTYNDTRPYPDQIRPWHFHTLAHPHPLERARLGIRCLIGAYERDLETLSAQWYVDRANPSCGFRLRLDNPYEISDDTICAQTIRDYFHDYLQHTDAKMLGPDHDRCHRWTRGLLHHHAVTATGLLRIGKESNPLLDPSDPSPTTRRSSTGRGSARAAASQSADGGSGAATPAVSGRLEDRELPTARRSRTRIEERRWSTTTAAVSTVKPHGRPRSPIARATSLPAHRTAATAWGLPGDCEAPTPSAIVPPARPASAARPRLSPGASVDSVLRELRPTSGRIRSDPLERLADAASQG